MRKARRPVAGVTLVEVLVALAIFALVGVASMTVLRQLTKGAETVAAKTIQLVDLNRAFRLLELDFIFMQAGSLQLGPDGLNLRRMTEASGLASVRYSVMKGVLFRKLSLDQTGTEQALLSGLGPLGLRMFFPDKGWQTKGVPAKAIGIEVTFDIGGADKSVRRIFPVLAGDVP